VLSASSANATRDWPLKLIAAPPRAGHKAPHEVSHEVPHDVSQAAYEQMREGDEDSARLHLAAIRRQLDAEEPQYRH